MKNMLHYGDGPRAIYEDIKQQIISGELTAGEELKIMPLAKEMNISIVPLREAIRILAAENLIELRPRRSPIIAHLDERELIEMNQIRGVLEPIILANAVAHHDLDSLNLCEKLIDQEANSTDLWEKVELNKQFHLAILAPSHLKRSIAIIADQYDGITRITQFRVIEHGRPIGNYHLEHATIFDAVSRKDSEQSQMLMAQHIERATIRAKQKLA